MGLRKATAATFEKRASEIAKELGAEPDASSTWSNGQVLQTKGGPMTIHPSTTSVRGRREGLFTVFCRFKDMDQMKAAPHISTAINPYSGKYNFHDAGHDEHLELALEGFRQHLQRAMP